MSDRILMDRRVEFELPNGAAFEFRWMDRHMRIWRPIVTDPALEGISEKEYAPDGRRTIIEIRVVTYV